MKKTMTLAEVKEFFGTDRCFETETAFGVNLFGKYQPDMTFIVPKEFNLGKDGKPISFLDYVEDHEVTGNMNLNFGGRASFIFGDYWRSKKGGACFRPKSPLTAKHLLVKVSWGGAFDSTRGSHGVDDALYFRRASSNGGGAGCDYWVLPVGYTRFIRDAEIDGEAEGGAAVSRSFVERGNAYREKWHKIFSEKFEEADQFLREKAAAEAESRQNRERFIPELQEIYQQAEELRQQYPGWGISVPDFSDPTYFTMEYKMLRYTEEGVERARKSLEDTRRYIEQKEAEKKAQAEAERLAEEKREAERQEKLKEEQAKAARLAAEAEAKAAGLPSDVRVFKRTGCATGVSKGYVITPEGLDRPRDEITGEWKRVERYDEGYEVWRQIMPGELVIVWRHAFTAAPHECEVLYRPDTLTEAQLERVAEIQNEIEAAYCGKACVPVYR